MKYLFYLLVLALLLSGCANQGYSPPENTCELKNLKLPELSENKKESLVERARQALDDYRSSEIVHPPANSGRENPVIVTLRSEGIWLSKGIATGSNLKASVYHATINASRKYNKTLPAELDVEISIVGNMEPLTNKSYYETGVHGLFFLANNSECHAISDKLILERNYEFNDALTKGYKKFGFNSSVDIDTYIFKSLDFGTTYIKPGIITWKRGNPVQSKNMSINQSLELAKNWFISNFEDGQFNYLYYPSNGNYPEGRNNMIRQLMASRLLAEFAQENKTLRKMHKENLEYIFNNWYGEEDNNGYVYFYNKSKLGANAMLLRTMAESPYLAEYQNKTNKVVETVLAQQNKNGSFDAWYIGPSYSYDEDYLLTFYSGEAILSLTKLYQRTGNEKLLDAAIQSQDFYLDKYVKNMDENYYPAYVPWHTISLYKLYNITGKQKYAEAIFKLNDRLLAIQNTDGRPYRDFKGRFYDPEHPEYGSPHVSSDAIYTEGLAYAYVLAKELNDTTHADKYKKRLQLATDNLIRLQFFGGKMFYLHHPERVKGAFRKNIKNNIIRIDNTQHSIDAFLALKTYY